MRGYQVKSRELLKLRLVSKRWKRVVESSIQNHADRHPINSGNGNPPTEAWQTGEGLPVNPFNSNPMYKYPFGATVFRTTGQITEFLNEMANYKGNPFPGKYVHFEIEETSEKMCQEFVKKGSQLLETFGEHVVVLKWELEDGGDHVLKMCKNVLKGLSSVPNLQSLKIWSCSNTYFDGTNAYFSKPRNLRLFPKLEKLESFDWQFDMLNLIRSSWADQMIGLYGGGGGKQTRLRKLTIHHKDWEKEMAANLIDLTELHLLRD